MTLTIIAIIIGMGIGAFLAIRSLVKRYKDDEQILIFLQRGFITVNEAREWRNTGSPPPRLTNGALSPYGDD